MTNPEPGRGREQSFPHPVAFWIGTLCCTAGVLLHLPMYIDARHMHYQLNGMSPDAPMLIGMALIGVGLVLAFYGLLPTGARASAQAASRVRVRASDDAPINRAHVLLIMVMAVAVIIDVMKPTSLSFVVPGFAKEYGLKAPNNPHGHTPASWLPLAGITGTVIGSWIWGTLGDWIGRRSAIMFAGLMFVTTSICGAMPGYKWNLLMCFMMGIGAGGMLPISFTLLAETIPRRHRGWIMVLAGGEITGGYVITSWLAGWLIPHYSWRILWLISMPTGLILFALNRWIPESPRFLIAHGRQDEAEAVLNRYGAQLVTVDEEEAAAAPSSNEGRIRMLSGPLVWPTIALSVLGIGVGLITYGFQLWVPTNLQHLGYSTVNSAYVVRNAAVIGLPLTILLAWVYHVLGGRRAIVITSAVVGVALMGFVVEGDKLAHHRTLLSLLLIIPLSGVSSVVAMVVGYASEVYPTRIRARGAGLAAGMTKAGGVLILAVVVASKTVPGIAFTALLGAVPLLLAAVVFLWVGPNTRNRSLEEISDSLAGAEPVPAS